MTKGVDPKFIFEHAEEVFRASDRLKQINQQTPDMDGAIPAALLNAFSTELFLKCLLAIETSAMPPRGHDLHALFMLLSKATRDRIIVFWTWYAQGMKDKWDVEEQLIKIVVPRQLKKP